MNNTATYNYHPLVLALAMALTFVPRKRQPDSVYYGCLDTETVGELDFEGQDLSINALFYDCGWSIFRLNEFGEIEVAVSRSYVCREIFEGEFFKEAMKNAYFAAKIPMYMEEIACGKRKLVSFAHIKKMLHRDCKRYGVKAVMAHNARFDRRATNNTTRLLTCSKERYFLPYGVEWWDTLKMARDVFLKSDDYKEFVTSHDLLTPTGRIPANAQALYAFLSDTPDFEESHTALEDVLVEMNIFKACMDSGMEFRYKL